MKKILMKFPQDILQDPDDPIQQYCVKSNIDPQTNNYSHKNNHSIL